MMPASNQCPPINFTFSPRSIVEIENIRRAWIKEFPSEEPDVVSVAWALVQYNNGRKREMPIVSFYTKDMRTEIENHIQRLSGLDVIFFVAEPDDQRFKGKVLDFSDEQGFFLRDP
jgi:hypothetical protein